MLDLAAVPVQSLPTPVVSVILFVVLWCVVVVMLSLLGGWQRLSRRFSARQRTSGKAFRRLSGNVGWIYYSRCLNVHTTREGLFISVALPLRLAHPPLFIPWKEIHIEGEERLLLFNARTLTFAIGDPLVAKMTLPKRVLEEKGRLGNTSNPTTR